MTPENTILVAGDFLIDHHIYEGRRQQYSDLGEDGVTVVTQLGGAALVHQLLEPLLARAAGEQWSSHLAIANPAAMNLDPDASLPRAYAFWRPFPRTAPRENQIWRVGEAMGFGTDRGGAGGGAATVEALSGAPRIVVLSEGGVGFRDRPDLWPERQLESAEWIVLKMTAPVAGGGLWKHLASRYPRKLAVLIAARELRQSPARVSAGLSWERTIADLLRELGPGGALQALTRCRWLIVPFDTEGAVCLDFGRRDTAGLSADTRVDFLYDAAVVEGDHSHVVEGSAYGFSSCLAATVAWQLASRPDDPDLVTALEAGLCAKRGLREHGHGPANETPAGFPAARLASAATRKPYRYCRARFTAGAVTSDPRWSLVRQSQRTDGPLYDLARLVALRGPVALDNVPYLKIGALTTGDWHEIEALRSMVQIMRRYQKNDPGKKPLSLGIFGPPGAGKSFAVRQLAEHVISDAAWLEFNLSQFSTAEDLTGAFHQMRDRVLQRKLPVAFFDEFDSQNYRWLKHLLAPMQDGLFQEGQLTHALGKCIVVFAGGTSWTFETFGPPALDADNGAERDFRLAKGPDFKSRLDGYFNVVGPNRRQVHVRPAHDPGEGLELFGGRWFTPDAADIHFPVRRALMIRAELKARRDEKLEIDEGLLYALLRVDRYVHGARSLGKILQPFAAARPAPPHRSGLLPFAQLDMHVDAAQFLALCEQAPAAPYSPEDPLTTQQLGVIAPAIHETYRELGRSEGWLKPELDRPFAEISAFHQAANLGAAQRMLDILALIRLRVEAGLATADAEETLRAELEASLETLAEAEHDGWMRWHFERGWRFAPKRDDERRLHNCLRPYSELPKTESDKDRATIRMYPEFARAAGLRILHADAVEGASALSSAG